MTGTNRARKGRAKRSRALQLVASGQVAIEDVVWKGYDGLGSCPIHKVLESAPTLGPNRVRAILERAKIYALLPLDQLTLLQREAILNEIPNRMRVED